MHSIDSGAQISLVDANFLTKLLKLKEIYLYDLKFNFSRASEEVLDVNGNKVKALGIINLLILRSGSSETKIRAHMTKAPLLILPKYKEFSTMRKATTKKRRQASIDLDESNSTSHTSLSLTSEQLRQISKTVLELLRPAIVDIIKTTISKLMPIRSTTPTPQQTPIIPWGSPPTSLVPSSNLVTKLIFSVVTNTELPRKNLFVLLWRNCQTHLMNKKWWVK